MEIPDAFNEQVECDIIFINGIPIVHMLDRCTRWHVATVVKDKTKETLINTIATKWVQLYGAPKELIMDGEVGVTSAEAGEYFRTEGIQLHVRAKDTHARYIERRGALFRDVVHKIQRN